MGSFLYKAKFNLSVFAGYPTLLLFLGEPMEMFCHHDQSIIRVYLHHKYFFSLGDSLASGGQNVIFPYLRALNQTIPLRRTALKFHDVPRKIVLAETHT